ncbi:MAG: SHOCT-like domain-containing protein [Anaerolineales bacterium]
MATPDERMKILKMLEEGKLSAEEAARLLKALGKAKPERRSPPAGSEAKWLRVRVTDLKSGRSSVNVNLPMSLVNVGLKLGAQFVPDTEGIDFRQVQEALRAGLTGKIVDVEDVEEGKRVEIYVE